MRRLFFCGFSANLLINACFAQVDVQQPDEQIEIPLKEMWGYNMPGTVDVYRLEPEMYPFDEAEGVYRLPPEVLERQRRESLFYRIDRAIPLSSRKEKREVQSGFAVSGSGREALQGAYDVLVDKHEPRERLPANKEVSLVFFTAKSQPKVHVKAVRRRGNSVEIDFVVLAHGRMTSNWHMALIPLGKLPAGEYIVKLVRIPMVVEPDKTHDVNNIPRDWEPFIVCRPFEFVVGAE